MNTFIKFLTLTVISIGLTKAAPPGGSNSSTLIQQVNGDTWVTSNATWDGRYWNRANTNKCAFALVLQGSGAIPYESDQGVELWVAQPGSNPINPSFGSVGGWNNLWISTNYATFIVGGAGIEVDGNGTLPYGRLLHQAVTGNVVTGIASNIFVDFSGVDSTASPSWFAGFVGDSFRVQRAIPGSTSLSDLLRVDADGTTSIPGLKVSASAPASSSSYCVPGQIASDSNYIYVCIAASTWKRTQLSTF